MDCAFVLQSRPDAARKRWVCSRPECGRVHIASDDKPPRANCLSSKAHEKSIQAAASTLPETCDVLQLIPSPTSRSWWQVRSEFVAELLATQGVTAGWHSPGCTKCDEIEAIYRRAGKPAVVINHTMLAGWDTIGILAAKYPTTKWLTVNHSSQSHLITSPRWIEAQSRFCELANTRPNCYFAVVDPRVPLPPGPRIMWLPNVVMMPDALPTREPSQWRRVLIAGRVCPLKNWPNQIIAAGMAAQTWPLEIVAVWRGEHHQLTRLAEQWKLPVRIVPWQDHAGWLETIVSCDVAMQCSFTESFNYVAIESLSCGVPVVGSRAIQFLPEAMQVANADNPESIASVLGNLLSTPPAPSDMRAIAADVAERNNAEMVRRVMRLVER